MGISWTTFCAQIVNLFVLAWLLKRFLYAPIVAVVAKRQAEIRAKLLVAQEAQEKAEQAQKDYVLQVQALEEEKSKAYAKAEQEIARYTNQQKASLKAAMEAAEQRIREEAVLEHQRMIQKVREVMAKTTVHVTRRLLKDLHLPEEGALIVQNLETQLSALKARDKALLKKLIKAKTPVRLVASCPLTDADVLPLTRLLKKIAGVRVLPLIREEDPRLIMGASLMIGSWMIDWNVQTYLEEFDMYLMRTLADLPKTEEE